MSDYGVRETAITLDQYRALMAGRTRPLTDRAMSTKNADKTRSTAAATYESPIPELPKRTPLELIPELRMEHGRERAACGTPGGYTAHLRVPESACPACREAHTRKRAEDRADRGRPSRRKAS